MSLNGIPHLSASAETGGGEKSAGSGGSRVRYDIYASAAVDPTIPRNSAILYTCSSRHTPRKYSTPPAPASPSRPSKYVYGYLQRSLADGVASDKNDSGAAINMHLAASLAVQQISPTPVAEIQPDIETTGGAGADTPRVAIHRYGGPASGSPAPPRAYNNIGGRTSDVRGSDGSSLTKLIDRAVDCAIRGSVMATELNSAPAVHLVAGFLDAESIRAREELLADTVVSAKAKKSGGATT